MANPGTPHSSRGSAPDELLYGTAAARGSAPDELLFDAAADGFGSSRGSQRSGGGGGCRRGGTLANAGTPPESLGDADCDGTFDLGGLGDEDDGSDFGGSAHGSGGHRKPRRESTAATFGSSRGASAAGSEGGLSASPLVAGFAEAWPPGQGRGGAGRSRTLPPAGGARVTNKSSPVGSLPRVTDSSFRSSKAGIKRGGELLLRVARMGWRDMECLLDEVNATFDDRQLQQLRKHFRIRAAELAADLSVEQLEKGRRLLLLMPNLGRTPKAPVFWKPDGASAAASMGGGEAELARWECPVKAFEDRLTQLAFGGSHDLWTLMSCYAVASDLANRGLIKAKVPEALVGRMLKWIQRESLPRLRRHAEWLVDLVAVEARVLPELRRRLARRAGQAFRGTGQLAGFSQLVLDLEARGLQVIDDPGNEVLDHATASMFPPMQLALLNSLRSMIKDWGCERLADELQGSALELLCCRQKLKEKCTVVITARVSSELNCIRDMIIRRADSLRVQTALLDYGRFVCSACRADGGSISGNGRGLVDLAEPSRIHLLENASHVGSLGYCAASVTPGTREFPPEYAGQREALSLRCAELWRMVTSVMALQGDDAESALAKRLQEERGLNS